MVWSRFLFFGNENFCLAVPLLFIFLGLLGSWDSNYSWRKNAAFLALATLIYFSHFLVFAVLGLSLTLHFALGKWNVRTALLHFIPVLPGSLLAFFWFWKKGSGGEPLRWSFNLLEKLQAFSEALCPTPWGPAVQSIAWQCFCISMLILFCVQAYRLWSEPSFQSTILLVLCSCGIALCLQRWTIIFIPDQRMWWMSLLMGLVLLPCLTKKNLVSLGVFSIPLAIGTSIAAGSIFAVPDKQLSMLESTFATFPKGLRLIYFGDPSLPPHLHRAFEYYHLRKGGRTTQHLIGKDQSIDFKKGDFMPPAREGFGMYDFSATAWIPYLDEFDGALIIGDSSKASNEIISALTNKGYRVATTGSITLLLNPKTVK